ncbi:MAG: hypothetical protein JSW11_14770 [Candidatus Heimdallarchaeota archaeon]|nr:MAG: hypothetical protein JSW11_14770 [Candidatus Heimdallarchaeota archaeon]
MSKSRVIDKIFCAKFTIALDDKIVNSCAFVSAPTAAEAWDLTELLAAFWNMDEEGQDASFKIDKVYKQPCSKNPRMIWTKKMLSAVRKKVGIRKIEFLQKISKRGE